MQRGCEHCGGPLTRGKRGPAPRFCSASCKARACDVRAKQDGRYAGWIARQYERRRKPQIEKRCLYCPSVFLTAHPLTKLCGSDECRRRHNSARCGPYATARRRTTRLGESFSRVEIHERDGWKCGLCSDDIDSALEHPHPLSASIDHVIPLSLGGAHTRANVRSAHLVCNQRRGTKDDSEYALALQAQAA